MINLELFLSIPIKGTLVSVHGCRWTQAASGAAGRANVGLCPASVSLTFPSLYASVRLFGGIPNRIAVDF